MQNSQGLFFSFLIKYIYILFSMMVSNIGKWGTLYKNKEMKQQSIEEKSPPNPFDIGKRNPGEPPRAEHHITAKKTNLSCKSCFDGDLLTSYTKITLICELIKTFLLKEKGM